MPSQSIRDDLQNFVQFATRRIERGEPGDSVEDLVQQWRSDSEYAAAVADVHAGLADDEAGKAQPVTDAFADIRRQLGIGK